MNKGAATAEATTEKKNWKEQTTGAKLSYQEQKEYSRLEKDIATLEKKREELQNKFATENWDGDEIDKQSIKLQNIIDDIDAKTERYFELMEKMES